MLSCLPNTEEVIDEAQKNGWEYKFQRGRHILKRKDKTGPAIILQTIPVESWYSHTVACNYARLLGLEIEPRPVIPD